MNRPWQVWSVFFLCAVAAVAAMLWLTTQALHSDRLRRTAQAEAELEQRISLALWRMDTALAPIIAAEVSRPPWENLPPRSTLPQPPPYVLLRFEARPDGTWRSPQVAGRDGNLEAQALATSDQASANREEYLAHLSTSIEFPQLLSVLPEERLPSLAVMSRNEAAIQAAESHELLNQLAQTPGLYGNAAINRAGETVQWPVAADEAVGVTVAGKSAGVAESKISRSQQADLEQRNYRFQNTLQQDMLNQARVGNSVFSPIGESALEDLSLGVSRPLWIDEALLLARRVDRGGETFVQGALLDWEKLKARLLAEAADLLTGADLLPIQDGAVAVPGRMLAGLPVRLVAESAAVTPQVSPDLAWALAMGWGAVLLAACAAGALLHGVMTLSERRAAFVSSVTHELRTPLTTFRLYADMLARGMVPDPAQQKEYLQTLESESERLTHLVENVLAYARLERGRKPEADVQVSLGSLLDGFAARLARRAKQAGMECVVEVEQGAREEQFATNPTAVEQILFNLVDNAAKYASAASDKQIRVMAGLDENFPDWLRIAVEDHGPGMQRGAWHRQVRAFSKSAQQSAETAPGVGLGLALCERLARQLGGRLEFAETRGGGGATVTLLLPSA